MASLKQDARPALQFYPHDWMTDVALKLCTLSARGLWIEMLCIMFDSPKRGCLLQANGKQVGSKELAVLVGVSEADAKQNLSTLEEAGVFSRLGDGTIYSRRMWSKWKQTQSKRKAGRLGGLEAKPKQKSSSRARPPAHSSSSSTSSSTTTTPLKTPISQVGDETNGFNRFWLIYPRRIGKANALKAWTKIKPSQELTSKILESVLAMKESRQWRNDGGKYIPHPATWLNRGGWDDEPEPTVSEQPIYGEHNEKREVTQQERDDLNF